MFKLSRPLKIYYISYHSSPECLKWWQFDGYYCWRQDKYWTKCSIRKWLWTKLLSPIQNYENSLHTAELCLLPLDDKSCYWITTKNVYFLQICCVLKVFRILYLNEIKINVKFFWVIKCLKITEALLGLWWFELKLPG